MTSGRMQRVRWGWNRVGTAEEWGPGDGTREKEGRFASAETPG